MNYDSLFNYSGIRAPYQDPAGHVTVSERADSLVYQMATSVPAFEKSPYSFTTGAYPVTSYASAGPYITEGSEKSVSSPLSQYSVTWSSSSPNQSAPGSPAPIPSSLMEVQSALRNAINRDANTAQMNKVEVHPFHNTT